MGAGASLSHLPEQLTKSECMILAGGSFSEQVWTEHSSGGKLNRGTLMRIAGDLKGISVGGKDLEGVSLGGSGGSVTEIDEESDTTQATTRRSMTLPQQDEEINIKDETVHHITSSDGSSTYEGTLLDGTFHGQGKLTFQSGAFYEGQFSFGKKHGQGLCKYNSRAIYCGEWINDKRNGQGVYKLPSGDEYRGGWKDNEKYGQGKYIYLSVDGGVYTGEWKHDKKHGYGTYQYSNGDSYTGYWLMGKKSGTGKYTYASGEVYEGEWSGNVMHGQGKFSDEKGAIAYEGEYKNGSIFNFVSNTDPNKKP